MRGAWNEKKRQVWKRAEGWCERCKEKRGAHVHHFRYTNRRGDEPLDWLQLVCLDCHGFYHPNHTFRSKAEQAVIARARAAKRNASTPTPGSHRGCRWCGGTYPKAKHRELCLKYGANV